MVHLATSDLITHDTPGILAVAFLIGIVVGLTGMGGGALMTPALIFLGVPPTAAVANDLTAAAINKSVGAAVHYKHGSPNLQLAKWLIIGSVPTSFAGAWIIKAIGADKDQQAFLKMAIGIALLITAVTFSLRIYLEMRRHLPEDPDRPDPRVRPLPTLIVGAVGGLLVGMTSVGSGSLIMISLLLLYPTLSARKLVGTDLVQAIPLVLSASISHILVSGIQWDVLIPLIVGGSPGTFLGARLAGFVSQSILRRGIAIVLTLTGLGLLKVPPVTVGILGAAMVILGPVVWGVIKAAHGRPAFRHVPLGHRGDRNPAPTDESRED
ncbi:MAG: sulfite exporter TauE/SafE family protein [Tetrasphaera sp.]|jgi:uncharacterized membrane protein YfcA|nr:sulfite exporter TauE/SafE family protein [Tetrasphaera sp.]